MPRPKGSKNKVKATKVTADFAAQIAAKQEEKAAVEAEILKVAASIEELKTDVKSLNADLKAKKASVKKLDKEVAKLEARQAAAAQKAADQAVQFRQVAFPGWNDELMEAPLCAGLRLQAQQVAADQL